MKRVLLPIAAAAVFLLILGWAGEGLGNWAGNHPDRIRTVLVVETLVLVGLLGFVTWTWRRYRRSAQGDRS